MIDDIRLILMLGGIVIAIDGMLRYCEAVMPIDIYKSLDVKKQKQGITEIIIGLALVIL